MAIKQDGGVKHAAQVEIRSLQIETSLSALRTLLIKTSPTMNKACQAYLAAYEAIKAAEGDSAAMNAAVGKSCEFAEKLAEIKSSNLTDLRAKWTVLDIEAGDMIEGDQVGVAVWNGIEADLERMTKPAKRAEAADSDVRLAEILHKYGEEHTRLVSLMSALEHVAMLAGESDDYGNCMTYNTFAAAAKSIAEAFEATDNQLFQWMVAAGKVVQS